jgi:hypothetical protein
MLGAMWFAQRLVCFRVVAIAAWCQGISGIRSGEICCWTFVSSWPFAEETRRVQWIDSGHTPAVLACVLRVFADFELRTESLHITNTNGASPEYSGVD